MRSERQRAETGGEFGGQPQPIQIISRISFTSFDTIFFSPSAPKPLFPYFRSSKLFEKSRARIVPRHIICIAPTTQSNHRKHIDLLHNSMENPYEQMFQYNCNDLLHLQARFAVGRRLEYCQGSLHLLPKVQSGPRSSSPRSGYKVAES